MSSKLGSEPLGKFYTGKKPKKRREWRGLKDTWYDYTRWLGYWKTLITFIIKPNNMKGFFRYRWMMNYLALPDFYGQAYRGYERSAASDGTQCPWTHSNRYMWYVRTDI